MAGFDYPPISEGKTNEQNIMSVKAYLIELCDQLNYQLDMIQEKLRVLETKIEEMER